MKKETARIIEINGVKMEVDLREAKQIDSYLVGDAVKVLVKGYGDAYSVKHGVITGFANFNQLPTIEIMYIEYGGASFVALNADTKGIEIVHSSKEERLFSKDDVLTQLNRDIGKKEEEYLSAKQKKEMFLAAYGKFIEKDEPVKV